MMQHTMHRKILSVTAVVVETLTLSVFLNLKLTDNYNKLQLYLEAFVSCCPLFLCVRFIVGPFSQTCSYS